MSTTVDLGKITASVTVGTTTTGAAGTNASVSNSGTTQDAVLNFTIPRGAQGVQGPQGSTGPQGPAGPTGPQGPMGDVAVITPEQQAAFTMYSVPGQNTDGPMTQKAVTDNLVASAISYDNSQSGMNSTDVQNALNEIINDISTKTPVTLGTATQGYIIRADGTWSSNSNTHSYWAIPCKEGDNFAILSNLSNTTNYAWLKSVNPSTGVMADFAYGETGRHGISANKLVSITAPAQTNYLYITNTNNNTDQSPQSVERIIFDKNRINDLENQIEHLNVERIVDLSLYSKGTGFINASGFTASTTYYGKFMGELYSCNSLRQRLFVMVFFVPFPHLHRLIMLQGHRIRIIQPRKYWILFQMIAITFTYMYIQMETMSHLRLDIMKIAALNNLRANRLRCSIKSGMALYPLFRLKRFSVMNLSQGMEL